MIVNELRFIFVTIVLDSILKCNALKPDNNFTVITRKATEDGI